MTLEIISNQVVNTNEFIITKAVREISIIFSWILVEYLFDVAVLIAGTVQSNGHWTEA